MSLVKYVLTFLLLAGFGLVLAYGVNQHELPNYLGLSLMVFSAATAGFLMPKGYMLWGLAVVSLHPFEAASWIGWQRLWLAFGPAWSNDTDLRQFVFMFAVITLLIALVCTIAAICGAGLRKLWRRRFTSSPEQTNL